MLYIYKYNNKKNINCVMIIYEKVHLGFKFLDVLYKII